VGERKKTNSVILHGTIRSHLDGIGAATVKVAVATTTAPDPGPRGAPPPHPNHLPSGSSPRPPPLQAVARRRRPALVPKPASMLFHPSPLSIFFSHFRFVLQVVVTPMAMAACYGGGSGASECGSGPYGTGSGAPRRGGVAARAGRCISHHGCCLCCFAPCRSREPKGLKQQGAIYSGGYRGGLVPGAAMLGDDGGRGRNPTPCPGSVDAVVAGGPRPFYRGGGEGVQTCFSNGSSALRHVVAGHLTTGAAAGGPVYARRNPSPVFYRCRQRRHHEVPISLLEGVVRGVLAAVHLLVGHGYWSGEILARRCAGAVIDDAFGRRCTPWRR